MPNLLKMAKVQSILSLHAQGRSQREIARTLGVDRETVRKYLLAGLAGSKPANAPTGSSPSKPAAPGTSQEPGIAPIGDLSPPGNPKPAIAPIGSPGPVSKCAPYREAIEAKAAEGLSAQRIYQDLAADGAPISYDSVRRYLRRLGHVRPLPFRRMECAAGEEAQVDFGTGAPIIGRQGKRQKTHVFRIVLSHSRKGYSEDNRSSLSEGLPRHGSGVRGLNKESPNRASDQSFSTSSTRPRPSYPSSGCTSAEPDSVSPDISTLVRPPTSHQEPPHE